MKNIFKNLVFICLTIWFASSAMAQNTPPEITRCEILPENPTLDDDLTCSYDYYDADGDPEDVSQRTVYWKKNGVYQTEFKNELTVPASATEDNELWEVELRVHDGTDQSEMATASVTFGTPVPNHQPEARDVQILPGNPTTTDDLSLSYTYYDEDGDPEDESQRTVYWQRNGEFVTEYRHQLTIPSSATQKGDKWRCALEVSDGNDVSVQVWADTVTIINSPPAASDLLITPSHPNSADALTASYTYSDADDDPETGSEIRWYKDTVLQPDYNDQLLVPASATSGEEQWYFTVRPGDGEEFGELQTSSPVTITTGINYSLSMSVSPEGAGTTEPPAGVHSYEQGTVVDITATPVEGYVFINWTGNVADPNSPTTTVTLSEDQVVTANFEWRTYELTMAVSPPGGGTTIPEEGVHTYGAGKVVYIEAIPAEGFRFVSWTSNVEYPHAILTSVTMSQDQSVTAFFEPIPTYILTMGVSPEGSGTTEPPIGDHTYYEGTVVNITATPVNGYEFVNWTGDVSDHNDPTTTITMNANESATANFKATFEIISTPTAPVGPGSGYRMQSLEFATGGSTSNMGHEVEYQFDWGDGLLSDWGAASRSHQFQKTGTLHVRSRARCQIHPNVISEWSESSQITISSCTLKITVTPSNAGTVNKNPDNSEYNYDQEVILTAVPSSNIYVFDHWSGDLDGTSNPDTITMKGEHDVTAHFRMLDEVVSTPGTVNGPSSGFKKQSLTFTTGGATSNFGHEVEYQFDWGDGSLSDWGIALKSHAYSDKGTYLVRSRARCKIHTNVISGWSVAQAVTISACNLTISINPPGAGSVTKDPDRNGYDYGDTVTLTATPNTGWKFIGWSGDHSGNNNPAVISIKGNMSITANFEQKTYTLTTHVTPSGTGNIIKSPDKAKYTHGEIVHCTAVANPDSFYQFDHWSGDISDTAKSISLTMDKEKTITAHFSRMDIKPPHLENCYPPAGACEIPKNNNIQFTIKDQAYGIALNSVQVFINQTQIINNGLDKTGGNVTINPNNRGYQINYHPPVPFPEKSKVTVHTKFSNLPGISSDSSYTFNVGSSKITTTAADTISLWGGTVIDSTNQVKIEIPAGALEESTEISIALADTLPALPDSVKGIGIAYYFGPAGLKLNIPVIISIHYSQSDLTEAGIVDPMQLSIYYFSTTKGAWTILTNLGVDTTNNLISCQVNEFCFLSFGTKVTTGISDRAISDALPSRFALEQNYPNPFNPETIIRYQIPAMSHVKLEVFNILGERIRILVDAEQNAGRYQVVWNGKTDAGIIAPSGIYFYALRWGNNVKINKAIFMK